MKNLEKNKIVARNWMEEILISIDDIETLLLWRANDAHMKACKDANKTATPLDLSFASLTACINFKVI